MTTLILIGLILPFFITLAACNDLVTFKIYNWLNGILLLLFIPASVITGYTVDQYLSSGLAFIVVLIVGMIIFSLRWMGGGDVKFAAVMALWFGWTPILADFIIYTMLFGGGLTLALLEFRALFLPAYLTRYRWILNLHDPKGPVPYGIALASGALCVLPYSPWFAPFLK